MLTLANGEAGRLEMRPEPFDACALLESVAAAASDLAAAKRLELVVDVPPGAVFVVADSSRIDQVLTNLVINSIKYTDAGQVRLSMRPYEPSTGLLRLAVADTGPGLPEHVLPTLLTPDRVVTGGERRGEGSGIGLAIVRTLVERLGGTIAVASRLGHGTSRALLRPTRTPAATVTSAAESARGTMRKGLRSSRRALCSRVIASAWH